MLKEFLYTTEHDIDTIDLLECKQFNLITGCKGIGKTTIMKRLAKENAAKVWVPEPMKPFKFDFGYDTIVIIDNMEYLELDWMFELFKLALQRNCQVFITCRESTQVFTTCIESMQVTKDFVYMWEHLLADSSASVHHIEYHDDIGGWDWDEAYGTLEPVEDDRYLEASGRIVQDCSKLAEVKFYTENNLFLPR